MSLEFWNILIALSPFFVIAAIFVAIVVKSRRNEAVAKEVRIKAIVAQGRGISWNESLKRIRNGWGYLVIQWEPKIESVWWAPERPDEIQASALSTYVPEDQSSFLVTEIPNEVATIAELRESYGERILFVDYQCFISP